MPPASFFFSFIGAVILGATSLAVAFIIVGLFSAALIPLIAPYFPYLIGAFVVIVAVILIWIAIMVCAYVGMAVVYFIGHPAKVNENSKGYGIGEVKEAGRREKKDEEE